MSGKLPVYESALLGRQNEVEAVLALLRQADPPVRLLSLTGPGGVGKTRLAVQIAADWSLASGIPTYFVALASLNDTTQVASAIALALDIQDSGAAPLIDALKDFLRYRPVHLLIDNFEQVRSAAPLIAELLAVSPHLQIIVTSRAPLRLPYEIQFPVPPLVLPNLDHLPSAYMLSNYAAVSLFVQRAQALDPSFSLNQANAADVAEICVHLDGLPLAIELAAARIQTIPPQAMRERLHSRLMLLIGNKHLPVRHQTLRAAIDWSYDLLSRSQRSLFTRMAVFSGSSDEECIRSVCNSPDDLPHLDDDLKTLIDQSLIRTFQHEGQQRYEALETIREYALEHLAERGETAAIRRSHGLHFVEMAEYAEGQLRGPHQQYWLARLEIDFDNIRSALGWALDSNEHELGLRLASALNWFWFVRGHIAEGRRWLEKLLTNTPRGPVQAQALIVLARLVAQNDINASQQHCQEALSIWQALGDERGLADAYFGLGRSAANRGDDLAAAIQFYEKSLQHYLKVEYSPGVADTWFALGVVAAHQGEHARALDLYRQCLALRREEGDTWGIARTLTSMAFTAADQYDFDSAHQYGEESLALYRHLADRASAAAITLNLAYIETLQGNYSLAESLANEALAIWQESGRRVRTVSVYRQLAVIALAQGRYAEARTYTEHGLTTSREAGFTRGLIWMLTLRGQLTIHHEDPDDAIAPLEEALGRKY